MKAQVAKYNQLADGEQTYVYRFEHDGKYYNDLFRNYGKIGVNGIITVDPPEEIVEWFSDIKGDPDAMAVKYDLIRANQAVESCNKGSGCSMTCDFDKKRRCELLTEQTRCLEGRELTAQFIDFVLENGFEFLNKRQYFTHHKL